MNIFGLCAMLAACLLTGGTANAAADKNFPPTKIMERVGCVTGEGVQVVALYGTYENKGLYAQKINIVVTEQDAGYLPAILLADFTGDGTEEIYLGMDSGGSGGFGFAYIYALSSGSTETLFDFSKVPMPYAAQYEDGYRMSVSDASAALQYSLDISARGEEYLSGLYTEDGTLKAPVMADVSAVNTVLPFFVNTDDRFHVLVMRRITGLYNADAFGYTQNFMRWDGTQFTTYFRLIGVYGSETT